MITTGFSVLSIILMSSALGALVFFLSFYGVAQLPTSEKLSAYECGFDPFEDARNTFDVRFYLVAILFILFDLEVAFLFPLAVAPEVDSLGFVSAAIFLLILTLGFYFEWINGALDWS